ncbi:MAG TPA: cytochrome P460 family protein [Haliangiales bacterium]|nr:cytochrome P460 family protein [Haliangiales bacterium]
MRSIFLLVLTGACVGSAVDDPQFLSEYSIAGYESWFSVDFTGDVPGHGDTFREVYVNPIGRSYPGGGQYPIGTILVKEVFRDAAHTDLSVIEIQRYVGNRNVNAPVDGGWVFTSKKSAADGETYHRTCWECHRQATYGGSFYAFGE